MTGKAKAQVRKFIRSKKREQYFNLGKSSITEFFNKKKLEISDKILKNILKIFSKDNLEDFYIALGEGLISKNDVLKALHPNFKEEKVKERRGILKVLGKKATNQNKTTDKFEPIKGMISGMSIHYAGCCHPLPGDRIVGAINTGKGITIHKGNCQNVVKSQIKDNLVKLSWNKIDNYEGVFVSRLKLIIANSFSVISEVTSIVATNKINISNLKIISKTENYFELMLDVDVHSLKELRDLKAVLTTSKLVFSVERV